MHASYILSFFWDSDCIIVKLTSIVEMKDLGLILSL